MLCHAICVNLLPWPQAAKAPHHDISSLEVESSVRFSEHLLYIQRRQRRTLGNLGQQASQLRDLCTVLAELQDGKLAPQVCFDLRHMLAKLHGPDFAPRTCLP